MKRLRNPRTGVDQGDAEVFSDFEDNGEMWTGSGPRERRRAVSFSAAFASPPSVQVSVSLWDMDTSAAIRAELVAENITCEGFEIVFRTWADSRAARLRAGWLAIGDLPHADDWDVD
ncbi:H-type lectin domain-containing protein [Leisingera sp. M523]|uniref:H-type lectin domain-containing protein n=1 Tax=Leisingera sp. M523 TaxID=2867013 RepID=UPI0021A37B3F|nr:H-type lectin domain-containing protein [Leisingera sp. M523]UWQ29725.1 H-type lectin domain-containing protein [Leisingera sp. M523]